MSDLIDRDYMLTQIEKAKDENRPFDYDSLIDFVKVLPNANKAELEEIRQIRPCMRNPEQEGHEEYNTGWNDAIKEFLCNIDNLKEIDNE